jgi:hypothetical protein
MGKKDEQKEFECIEFGCPFIFKCVTLHGKNCKRQGGEKIPTHRVIPQGASQRPYPRSRMMSYFINPGEGRV